jgi:PAS domain S-box-containing protein
MTQAVSSRRLARRLNLFSPRRLRLHGAAAYGFTLAVTAAACGLSLVARPTTYRTPFILLSAALLAILWLADLRHCVLSVAISAVFANYFLLFPYGHWSLGRTEMLTTCLWCACAVALAALIARLRASEDQARRVLASIAEGFFIVDREWKLAYANQAATEFIGKSAPEIIGPAIWEVLPEIKQTVVEQRLRACAEASLPVEFESHFRGKWGHMRAYPFSGGVCIFMQDVTAAKSKEAELRHELERLSIAYKAAQMGVWEWNIKTGEMFWSEEIPRMHGVPAAEFNGRLETWIRTVHPEDAPGVRGKLRDALKNRHDYHVEFRVGHPQEVRWLSCHGTLTFDQQDQPDRMSGVTVDITDQRLREETLRRAEKLATAGRMVATIAHEINNPLAAVTNLLYLARQDKSLTPGTHAVLRLADEQLARVNHRARQTLGFYRDNSTPESVGLAEMFEKLLAILSDRVAAKHIRVDKEFEESNAVLAIKGEVQQLFSNLLANAIDASASGGRVILRSKLELVLGQCPARKIRIQVEDFGTGISAADVPRVFEPFFTTKSDVGTGLGLWLSKQIVEKNNGCIEFRTRSGGANSGTCFSVVLPAGAEPAPTPAELLGGDHPAPFPLGPVVHP